MLSWEKGSLKRIVSSARATAYAAFNNCLHARGTRWDGVNDENAD